MVKLLDWKDRLDELLQSENVFSLIVAAQIQAKLCKKPEQKRDAKMQLIRLLYERNYSREQIIELLRLVDWMIRLPHNLDIEVKNLVDQIEEEKHMAYVTSFERIAREEGELRGEQRGRLEGVQLGEQKGKIEGMLKGQARILSKMIRLKYPHEDHLNYEAQISQLSEAQIDQLVECFLESTSLKQMFSTLE
jgi:hypothetical protein